MFPLYDNNPRLHYPIGTVLIIALNVLAWIFIQGLGAELPLLRSFCEHGLIPATLLNAMPAGYQIPFGDGIACVVDGQSAWLSLLSSMFMHGGWFHIIGNMWFLWVFGDNVEDAMGTPLFICFYLLCGLAAAAAQIASDPSSTVPMVGASGAIGGVMGAYARMYPRARVKMLLFLGFFVTTIDVPALFVLGYWFLLQILSGLPALGSSEGGVAFWAHAGGFAAGVVLSLFMVSEKSLLAHRQAQRQLHSRFRI